MFSEDKLKPFTGEDIRFTKKSEALYAIFLDWPVGESAIQALGRTALAGAAIERVDLLGGPELQFRHQGDALRLTMPAAVDGGFVPALRINGRGLT
jgi:alpha-L-fucosidase